MLRKIGAQLLLCPRKPEPALTLGVFPLVALAAAAARSFSLAFRVVLVLVLLFPLAM